MTRLLDVLQVTFYVVAIGLLVLLGFHATSVLKELSDGLKQDRVHHEQMLKDHERAMQPREGRVP